MTKFCTNALLNGGKAGEYGDCGLFFVNILGFVAIIALLIAVPMVAAKRQKKHFVFGNNLNLDGKEYALSSSFERKILGGQIFHVIVVVLSCLVLTFSILESSHGYSNVVNYLSTLLRVTGWAVLSCFVQDFIVRRSRFLISALCWTMCQVATAGMSCIRYQPGGDYPILSVVSLLYFVVTCVYVTGVILQLIRKTEQFDISNPLLLCDPSAEEVVIDQEVNRDTMDSLFIKQQKKREQSLDENGSTSSSLFWLQHQPESTSSAPAMQRTSSWRSADLSSEKMSTPVRPFSTSSKWSNFRDQFRSGFGNSIRVNVLDWEYFVLNDNNLITLYRIELRESKYSNARADNEYLNSNVVVKRHDELIFLEKKLSDRFPNINLPEVPVPPLSSRGDIDFGAKKEGQSNVDFTKELYGDIGYGLHTQHMIDYLSDLLGNATVGQMAYHELRQIESLMSPASTNRLLDPRFLSPRGPKPTSNRESQLSADDSYEGFSEGNSQYAGSSIHPDIENCKHNVEVDESRSGCLEVPPLGFLKPKVNATAPKAGRRSVRVTGVVQHKKAMENVDNPLFLIQVKSLPIVSPTGSEEARHSTESGSSLQSKILTSYENIAHERIIKKTLVQLWTFNKILSRSYDSHILDATTTFPVSSENGKDFQPKLSAEDLVGELDKYIFKIYTSRNTHIPLLLGFLETDIHDCSIGYDIVFNSMSGSPMVDDTQSISSPAILHTIQADTKSFKQRMQVGHARSKIFSSDGRKLNKAMPALNSLSPTWLEERNRDDDIMEAFGMEKGKNKEKRSSLKREPLSLSTVDIGNTTSAGFTASDNIAAIVSNSLAKLILLIQHVGGVSEETQPYQDSDSTEYLRNQDICVLNWRSSTTLSGEDMSEPTGEDGKDDENLDSAYTIRGVWLSQWRLRKLIVSSTAFSEISIDVFNLKSLSVKQLKKALDAEKQAFLINLYNLISLHATILMPWPHAADVRGRCKWQNLARYQIGDVQLSLFQIEYALLRSRLVTPLPPTIPQCFNLSITSLTDIKHLSSLMPKVVDVRALLALALPFRSSCYSYIYLPSVEEFSDTFDNSLKLQRELYCTTSEHLVDRIKCYTVESKVLVPKVLRRYLSDLLLFRKNYEKVSVSASPQRYSDDIIMGENVIGDNCTVDEVKKLSSCDLGNDKEVASDINVTLQYLKNKLKPVAPTKDGNTNMAALGYMSNNDVELDINGNQCDAVMISGWEKAAGHDKDQSQNSSMLQQYKKSCFGDDIITESEFQQWRHILESEIDIKDRKYHFRTYSNSFLGIDAVNCLSNYIPGGREEEAIAVGNNLIEYGIIRHVVDEHWLKPKDLFYTFGDTSVDSGRQMTPFLSFIVHHISESGYSLLNHQISTSEDLNFSVVYLPEDYRFKVPLKIFKK